MALTLLPHSLPRLRFFHENPLISPPFHRDPTSKTPSTESLRLPALRFPATPSDRTTLKTWRDSKIQFRPLLTPPRASGSQISLSEGVVPTKGNQTSYAEAYAIGRHIPMSANKARRVIDQIRGRTYEETLVILELMPYRACDPILKLVYSAAANATNNMGLNEASLFVSKAVVNEGTTRKKIRPQSKGRAFTIRRRTCHISVVLKDSSL